MDALITNFHLPESTLVMLVSAFAGREQILNAYNIAVQERYRFFSFGDAMYHLLTGRRNTMFKVLKTDGERRAGASSAARMGQSRRRSL